MSVQEKTHKARSQARGDERRDLLVRSASELLETLEISEITLPQVAENVGMPASSAYHFFSEPRLLLIETARRLAREFSEQEFDPGEPENWKDLVSSYIAFGAEHYNSHRPFCKLIHSSSTTAAIRAAGCFEDARFAQDLERALRSKFDVPQRPDLARAFLLAIQISDTMFGIAVRECGKIDERGITDARQAVIAYLNLFIPDILPRLP